MVAVSDARVALRRRVLFVSASNGVVGLLLLTLATVLRAPETSAIASSLRTAAPILVATLFLFAFSLALLRFRLTEEVFATFILTAATIMIPILGVVISAWTSVTAAVLVRLLSIFQIGPTKASVEDRFVEYTKTFGLFGTYGVPIIVASLVYELLGGRPPHVDVTLASAARIAICGIALQLTNILIMIRVELGYGYTLRKATQVSAFDLAIFVPTLPFAILVTLGYATIGWPAIAGWSLIGIMFNFVGRKLAVAQSSSRTLLMRVASLTNLGRTIALNVPTDELLWAIYEACKQAVDVSFFTIALVDEGQNELSFELDVRNGQALPKSRLPLGEGLTSWVVLHRAPLLLRSNVEERRLGLTAVVDDEPTESWLGVPMMARNHVVGAISIQSYKKNRFSEDDVVLLTSIANQAAVALENARLFQDLEGFTQALEERVAERTSELRETNLQLVAADRSKSQFLANMSHELRTPLNSIIGFSAILLRALGSVIEPRFFRFIENIHSAGSHLLNVINDILDLSKIEAGRMQMTYLTFDLREAVASVERVMKGVAAEAQVSIVTSIDPDMTYVHLDEGRLKQILFNLLSNAVKFSPSGSLVTLAVDRIPSSSSPIRCDSIRISVSDRGIGIADSELPKIFDHFHQTDEGRRLRKQGTGLGLSLTRSFTQLLGGTIDVSSRLGAGTTFVIYLPIHEERMASSQRPEQVAAKP